MNKIGSDLSLKNIRALLFESKPSVRIINLITFYRIFTFPFLIFLILIDRIEVFKWFLLASFFTDAIDGFLSRKYKATSVLGAKPQFDFVKKELTLFLVLFGIFLLQLTASLIRYKKISSFHTYLAKTAAVATAIFLLSVFFLERILYPFFYAAYVVTLVELIEEIVLVLLLPQWKVNVKGLYWVLKKQP